VEEEEYVMVAVVECFLQERKSLAFADVGDVGDVAADVGVGFGDVDGASAAEGVEAEDASEASQDVAAHSSSRHPICRTRLLVRQASTLVSNRTFDSRPCLGTH
jgi:hypothetical protein